MPLIPRYIHHHKEKKAKMPQKYLTGSITQYRINIKRSIGDVSGVSVHRIIVDWDASGPPRCQIRNLSANGRRACNSVVMKLSPNVARNREKSSRNKNRRHRAKAGAKVPLKLIFCIIMKRWLCNENEVFSAWRMRKSLMCAAYRNGKLNLFATR
jgi:hypothetical protein